MIFRGVKYGKEYIDKGVQAYEERLREKKVHAVNRLIKSFDIRISEITESASFLAVAAGT